MLDLLAHGRRIAYLPIQHRFQDDDTQFGTVQYRLACQPVLQVYFGAGAVGLPCQHRPRVRLGLDQAGHQQRLEPADQAGTRLDVGPLREPARRARPGPLRQVGKHVKPGAGSARPRREYRVRRHRVSRILRPGDHGTRDVQLPRQLAMRSEARIQAGLAEQLS